MRINVLFISNYRFCICFKSSPPKPAIYYDFYIKCLPVSLKKKQIEKITENMMNSQQTIKNVQFIGKKRLGKETCLDIWTSTNFKSNNSLVHLMRC